MLFSSTTVISVLGAMLSRFAVLRICAHSAVAQHDTNKRNKALLDGQKGLCMSSEAINARILSSEGITGNDLSDTGYGSETDHSDFRKNTLEANRGESS